MCSRKNSGSTLPPQGHVQSSGDLCYQIIRPMFRIKTRINYAGLQDQSKITEIRHFYGRSIVSAQIYFHCMSESAQDPILQGIVMQLNKKVALL